MADQGARIERDSMGEMAVPADALYGATTARAIENFPISGLAFSRSFLRALGLIKAAAAEVNGELGLLAGGEGRTDHGGGHEVAAGDWDDQFPIDIFQTGSGTSTNMNANEVIANRADAAGRRRSAGASRTTTSTCARAATTSSRRRSMSPPTSRSPSSCCRRSNHLEATLRPARGRDAATSSRPAART